jgi:hypothetical protein
VISAPGTYRLDANLTCPTQIGIDVEASNVTLQMNRHSIDVAGGFVSPIRVANNPGLSGVRILGPGTVRGATNYGLEFLHAPNSLVLGVTATDNRIGMYVVDLDASSGHVQLIANKLNNNNRSGGNMGLYIIGGSAASNLVAYNECSNNTANGIEVGSNAGQNVTVYGNTCMGNGGIGIRNMTAGNTIAANTAKTNGTDLSDDVVNCVGVVWFNNDFNTKNQMCVQ